MSSCSTVEHGGVGLVHVFGTEFGEPFVEYPDYPGFGYENRSGMAIIVRVLVAVNAAIAATAGNLATNDAPVNRPATLGATKRPLSAYAPHVVCLYISEGGRREDLMTDIDIDELGPIDYLVVEFPPGRSHFTGEMAAEIGRLVDAKLIRVLDLLILQKAEDGTIEAFEIDDLDAVDELRAAEGQLAELLAEEDVEHLAAAMEPGTTAGVLVWENAWAAPFASAARRAGGQLIASGRIPIQAILASLEADESIEGD